MPPDLVAALAAAGLPVVGGLADRFADVPGERFDGLLPLLAAAEAGRVVAAVVAPSAGPLLLDLVLAGLPVLLAEAAPWGPDLLTEVRDLATSRSAGPAGGRSVDWARERSRDWSQEPGPAVPRPVPVGVLLRSRCAGWAAAADAAVRAEPGPPVQAVVRGWGSGPAAEAGLVDLLLRWCGDVVAVCAAPHALPATSLPDGEPVGWALLGEGGTTVLVAPGGSEPQVRLSFPTRRLVAGPGGTSWSDGTPVAPVRPGLPLLEAPGGSSADGGDGAWTASEQLAGALAGLLRTGSDDGLGHGVLPWPWPPDLVDLLPVSRVLAARDRSLREQRWVELA